MRLPGFLLASVLALVTSTSLAVEQFSALLFTKAAGWHHDSINAGVTAVQELGLLHEFKVFWTEDASRVFNDAELAKYKVVIFMLTTGDVLNDEQQVAFQKFIRAGGGFVGIYSASDTESEWPWYTKMVGHRFRIHPEPQTAVLQVEDANFPGMERFPKRFLATEVWYEFEPPLADDLHYLLTVDETTYDPVVAWDSKQGRGMGAFHPISWYHNYDGGRAFYTGLGHIAATFSDPAFRHHIFGGIYWAATGKGFRAE
jgi:type 1 glutamine amidotransferase